MKSSELRLNNYVLEDGVCVLLSTNYDLFKCLVNVNRGIGFEPIPLTEEWLLKFGFEKSENNWKFLDLYFGIISWEKLAGTMFCLEQESIFLPHIKYVHQLQNLYFALTGEVLTFKSE
jgi:hypothetical protein